MKKWIAQAWLFVLMGLVGECWAQAVLRVEVERGSLERRLQATPRDLRIEQIKVAGGTIRLTIETPVPSLTHRIEERELVDTGSWTPVQNVTFSATGPNIITAEFATPAGAQKFYRAVADTQPMGTNAPPSIANSTITLAPEDGTGNHILSTDSAGNYFATYNDGTTESGTYTYTPSGDNATLVLFPNNGATISNIDLTFAAPANGTYASDNLGAGSFSLASSAR